MKLIQKSIKKIVSAFRQNVHKDLEKYNWLKDLVMYLQLMPEKFISSHFREVNISNEANPVS